MLSVHGVVTLNDHLTTQNHPIFYILHTFHVLVTMQIHTSNVALYMHCDQLRAQRSMPSIGSGALPFNLPF